MMKLSWRGSVVVAIACLFLVLVACGDDGSDLISRPENVSSSAKKSSSSSAKDISSSSSLREGVLSPCRGEDSDDCKYDSLYDERDGQTYKIVKIGKQWWMAENLNYKTDSSLCYKLADSNCTKYGRLYPWGDIVHGGGCPNGWFLPTSSEIYELELNTGSSFEALVAEEYGGVDAYGFSVKLIPSLYEPDGDVSIKSFDGEMGSSTEFWPEDQGTVTSNLNWSFSSKEGGGSYGVYGTTRSGLWKWVRCVRNPDGLYYVQPCKTDSTDSCEYGTLTDERDGQTYKTVKVGTQTWMAENLNYEMENSSCYGDDSLNCIKKGRLYSVTSAQSACPKGWHLPTTDEWKVLDKVTGLDDRRWQAKGVEKWPYATDMYGLSVIPGGAWNHLARGYLRGDEDAFFCSVLESEECSGGWFSYSGNSGHTCINDDTCSIRCIKDED